MTQLQLLDSHDAAWISAARSNEFSETDRREFLRTYGLLRGKAGQFLSKSIHDNWSDYDRICRQPLEFEADAIYG